MNSISEYSDSDVSARIGFFRFSGGIALNSFVATIITHKSSTVKGYLPSFLVSLPRAQRALCDARKSALDAVDRLDLVRYESRQLIEIASFQDNYRVVRPRDHVGRNQPDVVGG